MVEPEIKDVTIVLSNRIIVSESNPNHKNGIKEDKKILNRLLVAYLYLNLA